MSSELFSQWVTCGRASAFGKTGIRPVCYDHAVKYTRVTQNIIRWYSLDNESTTNMGYIDQQETTLVNEIETIYKKTWHLSGSSSPAIF